MAAFGWDDALDLDERGRVITVHRAGGGTVEPAEWPSHTDVKAQVSCKEYAQAHLERNARGELVCPICGSGSHAHGTSAFAVYPDHWACYACDPLPGQSVRTGDVFDLAAVCGHIDASDHAAQLRAVCEWAGIDPGGSRAALPPLPASQGQTAGGPGVAAPAKVAGPGDEERFAAERERHASIVANGKLNVYPGSPGLAYWQSRGFTEEEVEQFGLGWRTDWQGVARGVVPWTAEDGEWRHTDRRTDSDPAHKYDAPAKDKVGSMGPFGIEQADGAAALWLVEGQVDALSIRAVGARAMACGGKGRGAEAAAALAERGYKGVVLVAFDRDEGEEAEKTAEAARSTLSALLAAGLRATLVEEPLPGGAHDFNDLLAKDDRAALSAYVQEVEIGAESAAEEDMELDYARACRELRLVDPLDVVRGVAELSDPVEPLSTGIKTVDDLLDGGIYRGLYVLAAASSLGKTTLAEIVASNIAASGHPVLFVTIEQSASEIVRKAIARFMWAAEGGEVASVGTREMVKPSERARWGRATAARFDDACTRYAQEVAPHTRLMEGTTKPSAESIITAARRMADHDGEAPVVFVDYLQLLAQSDERASDKQAADRNVTALRMLSRDLRVPVFVLSSISRSAYKGPLDMDSVKESGGIEYGADVLMGLQPYKFAETLEKVDDRKRPWFASEVIKRTKAEEARRMELVLIKQREGAAEGSVPLTIHQRGCTVTEGVAAGPVDVSDLSKVYK